MLVAAGSWKPGPAIKGGLCDGKIACTYGACSIQFLFHYLLFLRFFGEEYSFKFFSFSFFSFQCLFGRQ